MTRPLLLYFLGAGGGGDATGVRAAFPDFDVTAIGYPDWPDLADPHAAMDRVLLQAQRAAEVADQGGPIVVLGYSLGAQIGLAIAHRLAAAGRPVAFFCALDGKFVSSGRPERGWVQRAFGNLGSAIARGDARATAAFIASRAGRLYLRGVGDRLPALAQRWAHSGKLPLLLAANPTFEGELRMRLLIAAATPWMQRLPADLPPLLRPAMLLRVAANTEFDRRWQTLCPEIEIVTIEGDHHNLLEPARFEQIAGRFRAALGPALTETVR